MFLGLNFKIENPKSISLNNFHSNSLNHGVAKWTFFNRTILYVPTQIFLGF